MANDKAIVPPRFANSGRLILRCPKMDDAEEIFNLWAQDEAVTKYLSWKTHSKLEQTERYLQYCISSWRDETSFLHCIEMDQDDHPLIGCIHTRISNHGVEIGYLLAGKYWGNGYMAEAVQWSADWWLLQDGVFRFSAHCDRENTASARVMEKAGLKFEGILRRYNIHPNVSGKPRDSLMYAKTRNP